MNEILIQILGAIAGLVLGAGLVALWLWRLDL